MSSKRMPLWAICAMAMAAAVFAGPAMAADVTVDLSGSDSGSIASGTAHYAGADALVRAMNDINAEDAAGSTITINESGDYEGGILIGEENITIQAANGVSPIIAQSAAANNQSIAVGRDASGDVAGSLTLSGDTADNRMIIYTSPVEGEWEDRAFMSTPGSTGFEISFVEFRPTASDVPDNLMLVSTFGSAQGVFNTVFFNQQPQAEGAKTPNGVFERDSSGNTFNDCDWISAGNWVIGHDTSGASTWNNCYFTGQSLRSPGSGIATFNNCEFEGMRVVTTAAWYSVNTNMVFDGCTYTNCGDVVFWPTNGGTYTVRNSTLDENIATVLLARVLNGTLIVQDCVWTGRRVDWSGKVTGQGGHYVFERVFAQFPFFQRNGANAESDADRSFIARNCVFVGTEGNTPTMFDARAGAAGVAPTEFAFEHCTITGVQEQDSSGDGFLIWSGDTQLSANYTIFDASQTSSNVTMQANAAGGITGVGNIFWDGNGGKGTVLPLTSWSGVVDPMLDANGKLLADSPALGNAQGSTYDIDFEGDPRPAGNDVPDIGGDESDEINTGDTDNDGLTDPQEANRSTNPFDADTDGDGLRDGAEVNQHNTDPLSADSDGDGVSDGQEVDMGADPNDANDTPQLPVRGALFLAVLMLGLGAAMLLRRRQHA